MIYESVIIGWFIKVYNILAAAYAGSATAAFFRCIGGGLKRYASGSWVVRYFSREGFLLRTWKYSGAGYLMDGVLNLPTKILHKLYLKIVEALEESYAFKVLKTLLNNLHIAISLFLVLVIIIPQKYWSNAYNLAAALLFLVLFYLKNAISGSRSSFTRVFDIFLSIFIITIILSEVFSLIPKDSTRFLLFYISCFIMMAILALSIETRRQLMHVIEILLVGISLSGMYGVWQWKKGVPVNAAQIDLTVNEGMSGRIYSTMENPNNFAIALTLFLPFFITVILNSKNVVKKLLFLILAVPCLFSLEKTLSRSGWIGFAVAIFIFIFFTNKKLIPIFILLGALSVPFIPQSIYRRLASILNPADSSTSTRMDIYKTVWPMVKDYWFSGLGLGNDIFRKMIQNYYLFVKMIPAHCHDLYLQVWVETGIVGLLSFLAFLGGLLKKCIKGIAKTLNDKEIRNVLIGGVAAIIGVCVIGIVEYIWFYARVMLLFWCVLGIILAALAIHQRKDENPSEG